MIDRVKATNGQATGAAGAAQQIGGIRIAKVTYEHHPLYGSISGSGLYGLALDDVIRTTFEHDPDAIIQSFKIEVSPEAAVALRDRCNRGEY